MVKIDTRYKKARHSKKFKKRRLLSSKKIPPKVSDVKKSFKYCGKVYPKNKYYYLVKKYDLLKSKHRENAGLKLNLNKDLNLSKEIKDNYLKEKRSIIGDLNKCTKKDYTNIKVNELKQERRLIRISFLMVAFLLLGLSYVINDTTHNYNIKKAYANEKDNYMGDFALLCSNLSNDKEFLNNKLGIKNIESNLQKLNYYSLKDKERYSKQRNVEEVYVKVENRLEDNKKISKLFDGEYIVGDSWVDDNDINLNNKSSDIDKIVDGINYDKEDSKYNNAVKGIINGVKIKLETKDMFETLLQSENISDEDLKFMDENIENLPKNIKEDYSNKLSGIKKEIEDKKEKEIIKAKELEDSLNVSNNQESVSNTNTNSNKVSENIQVENKETGGNSNNNSNNISNVSTGTNIGGVDASFQYTSAMGGFSAENIVYQWTVIPNHYLAETMSQVGQAVLGLGVGSTFTLQGQQRTVVGVEYGFVNNEEASGRLVELQERYGASSMQTCETYNSNSTLRMVFFN